MSEPEKPTTTNPPPVDLGLIRRQVDNITSYLKEHVWTQPVQTADHPTEESDKTP